MTFSAEETPNPSTYRFVTDQVIAKESVEFADPEDTGRSPLATKLFGFPWVEKVFIGETFVSITKQDWVEWDVLTDPLTGLIEEHFNLGLKALVDARPENQKPPTKKTSSAPSEDDDIEVRAIKTVIEEEIRPAVAMDGGDVAFDRYENGIVYIHMRGACSGCPSATMTLKMGIEVRIKEAVPSVKEVVAL